ncbi:VOC family protein [Ruminiclostridium papyrosolvens]|uniref:VOC domain-containing protein n=1 Tax=Ruminiclostridium papyrosolvens C7 TaxID=1330534 RepID=U4R023_9FIRM|nr:VOC family protein [Ruminiclostridium papyrosolvens]EPR10466.1 hypothetical protein L323_12500 [Ruminiclostridium papyrosolvens C7]
MLLHVDLFVHSMERSLDFYVNKLGMEVVDDTQIDGELVDFVSNGAYHRYRLVLLKVSHTGSMIELMEYMNEDGSRIYEEMAPSPVNFTILVNSLERKMEKLFNYGIKPISKVFSVDTPKFGKTKIVFYEDPDKNVIELLQMEPCLK